jgi:lipoate-protein ligase A
MAADEMLLQTAGAGELCLRFYTWTRATLSLGYFQPAACRLADPRLSALPYVRRPTGGASLVHHHELTYALAVPQHLFQPKSRQWLSRMHDIIAAALRRLGVQCELASSPLSPADTEAILCFHRFTPGDVLCAGGKIAGSAQRKHRHALLQHGAILLSLSPFAPGLLGIQELCARRLDPEDVEPAVVDELAACTGWRVSARDWTEDESARINDLAARKYQSDAWNKKR